MKQIQIAIDGPASSGKSTVAKIIAKNLGYTYLDTGAMYRAATYLALRHDLTEADVDQLVDLLNQYPVSFGRSEDGTITVLAGEGEAAIAARAGISIAELEQLNPSHMSTGSWYANPGDVVKIR